MDPSLPPPEAVLIRLVRQAAKITVAVAAKRAGISTARWTQVEQGYETRGGERKPAWAPPDTLAYMAAAIDLPPDRLEAEGRRPDAAAVLREMQRPRQAGGAAAGGDSLDGKWASFSPREKALALVFLEMLDRAGKQQGAEEESA